MTDVTDVWKREILPVESPETKPFWDACRRNELIVQRCRACGMHQWHYRAICCHCWSDDVEDRVSSGDGTIATFSIVHRNATPGFRDEVPYVTADIEMRDEGVFIMSNVINVDPNDVYVGMPVKVTFVDASSDIKVFMFERSEAAAS